MKKRELREMMTWYSCAFIAMVGLLLLLIAQSEISGHPSYNWKNPSSNWSYSQAKFVVKVLRVKYIGIATFIGFLPSAVMSHFTYKKHRAARKDMEEYYIRGGIVTCPHCELSVLGDVGRCPRCGTEIIPTVWDGNIDKVRTILEVPMQTNHVDEVLELCNTVLPSSMNKQKKFGGEMVWVYGSVNHKPHLCIGAVFSKDSVLLQGWRVNRLGEYALVEFSNRAQRELLDKMSAMIRARNL